MTHSTHSTDRQTCAWCEQHPPRTATVPRHTVDRQTDRKTDTERVELNKPTIHTHIVDGHTHQSIGPLSLINQSFSQAEDVSHLGEGAQF